MIALLRGSNKSANDTQSSFQAIFKDALKEAQLESLTKLRMGSPSCPCTSYERHQALGIFNQLKRSMSYCSIIYAKVSISSYN
mmetsp:Transcript_30198/g.53489  ORF Transcript_30198/g.53489 Transcript_30198/m.53489 type:complete len:83 (+) Transcript_30198:406-654(+)